LFLLAFYLNLDGTIFAYHVFCLKGKLRLKGLLIRDPVFEMRKNFPLLLTKEIKDASPFLRFPRIISVSGKGGVGKTNVVINLAFAFARLHKNVFVLDGDLGLPNIHTLLGLVSKYTFSHFIKEQEIPWKFMIEGPAGITILPGSSGDLEFVNLDDRAKITLIEKMELITKATDIILIDTESGLSSNSLFFNRMASNSIIIITPEPTSIINAQALIKELSSKNKKKKFAILVNFGQNEQEAIEIYRKFAKIVDHTLGHISSLDFLGFVPFDDKLQEAVRKQRAVLDMCPHGSSSRSFMAVAKSILEKISREGEGTDYPFLFRTVLEGYLPALNKTDDGNQEFNLEN
jgi:flagellar biosynthesis protein FlhG